VGGAALRTARGNGGKLFLALTISFFTTQFSIGLAPAQFASGDYVLAIQTILAMAVLVSLIPAVVIRERDRSLAELRESEERFKNLSAAAFEGICISEGGRILDVNNQFLAMFGYGERVEMIGRQIIELVAPEWRNSVAGRIRAGDETIYGHQLLRKNGSTFPAEAQAKIIRIGDRVLRMTALRDVTERKRAEQALRESEEKFSKAFRTSPDVMSITDFETGHYLEVNDAHEKIFGFKREEVVGRSPIELGIFENHAAREKMLEALKEHNSFRNVEIEACTRAGKKLILLHSAELIELGGRLCVLRVSQDITDQKKAEQALRNSEALFRSYFELAVVGCAISSLDKGIVAVNDQFCQMLGYSREELMKMTWVQLTHPNDVAADVTQFNRILAGEIDSYTLDKRYLHKNGHEIFATISIRCVRHPDGSPNYFVGLAMDITDRHKAVLREQQARIEYTLQLIAAQETERARIGAELHDSIGQNLLLVKNRVQLALTRKRLPADLREQLEDIGKLALQTIAEVRQISRDLHPYQIEHLGLTRALAAIIDNAAEASSIKFEKKLESADDVFSREAATHIYRIVQECLNNILKHSQAKKSRIILERDVHEVQLTIDDNGCGFEPDKTKNGRNGLGLKNIAARVQMLGGRLGVDSAPGKGTHIKVTIPILAEIT
jgi:two-component system, NarL family, sensor histidine kinase UhpB